MEIRNRAFIHHTEDYDAWFERNENIYNSELRALKLLNVNGNSLEIGIGTGKFAIPLNIKYGIDPTEEMLKKLPPHISCARAVAEYLPIKRNIMDWTIVITTICFVTDPEKTLQETYRVLKKGGKIAIGFVDANSNLGKIYLEKKSQSKFYNEATFFTSDEISHMLINTGFKNLFASQTLFGSLEQIKSEIQEPKYGSGKGSFVIICGEK